MKQKLSLIIRLRMIKDYFFYVVFLQKEESLQLAVEIFIFFLSVYLLTQEIFPTHASGAEGKTINIVVGLIILKFLWETYYTQKKLKLYFRIQHSILHDPSSTAHIIPSKKEHASGFIAVNIPTKKPDRVFVSSKINRHIQTTPLNIVKSDQKKQQINVYLRKHQEILLQYLNYYFFSSLKNSREFTNDQKFCISADIKLNSKNVLCHTGGYYDSFLTNQIIGTTLIVKDKKILLLIPNIYFLLIPTRKIIHILQILRPPP